MTDREALVAARQLLTEPGRWTKSASARDKIGRNLKIATQEGAVRWSGTGALMYVTRLRSQVPGIAAYSQAAIGKVDSPALGRWEDRPEATHAEVLDAFDRALAKEWGP